jgi:protein TonB
MFEDSTFESAGKIRTRSSKWMPATFALNGSVLLALILIPLIYPQALPHFAESVLVAAPPPPIEPARPLPAAAHASSVQPRLIEVIQTPSQIPKGSPNPDDHEAAVAINTGDWGSTSSDGPGSPDSSWNSRRQSW